MVALRFCSLAWSIPRFRVPAADEKLSRIATQVRNLGGQVTFDETNPDKPVITVDLHRAPVGDNDLAFLDSLSTLKTLDLSYTRITDAGLKHVRGLKGLKRFALHGTKITDDGLNEIAKLAELENLFLAETAVTDRGLEHLRELTKLESLELDHTQLSDAGSASFTKLNRLRRLVLNHTQVGDDGLKQLEGLWQAPGCGRVQNKSDQGRNRTASEGIAGNPDQPLTGELAVRIDLTYKRIFSARNGREVIRANGF